MRERGETKTKGKRNDVDRFLDSKAKKLTLKKCIEGISLILEKKKQEKERNRIIE